MPVTQLEHYLVVSDELERTRDFYCDILGLAVGDRPDLGFAGYWLYLGDVACLHLADRESYTDYKARVGTPVPQQTVDTGAIDHIAFNATGFDSTIEMLQSRGLEYRRNDIDDIGLKQLFIQDPNAITLELNFRD
ncbi:MAG: VOC family protein [Gammaproteobacteria bacterium]|jgi:catechol 2,3-dioxygenase-like lactoylglutathione lyase family enzyme